MGEENELVKMVGCNHIPAINVLTEDDFKERAASVLQILENVISKSFGAYGAPTIISNYPYRHATKDGYTIARNVEFLFHENDEIDRVIALFAVEICSRLNYTVGDGTTTAIVAVNQLYQSMKELLCKYDIRPRDFLKIMKEVSDTIIEKLKTKVTPITDANLADMISKVVYISSNGDKEITYNITRAYSELGAPSIMVKSTDEQTNISLEILEGYRIGAMLGSNIYINNDEKTAKHKNVDVIMFDHKVTEDAYRHILQPLSTMSKDLGRYLVCLAPWYDEILLTRRIQRDVQAEVERTGSSSLIIMSCEATGAKHKKQMADLAMLLNTTLIDKGLEDDMIALIQEFGNLRKVINMDERKIQGINVYLGESFERYEYRNEKDYQKMLETIPENDNRRVNLTKTSLMRLGFAREMEAGMKSTKFVLRDYNEDMYNRFVKDAKDQLNETVKKYALIGTQTQEVSDAQERYTALKLKTATILVGSDSELSKGYTKDLVVDAVHAAESAFRHGCVQGCNLDLILSIKECVKEEKDPLRLDIMDRMQRAFMGVYQKVLQNAFGDVNIDIADINDPEDIIRQLGKLIDVSDESMSDDLNIVAETILKRKESGEELIPLSNFIITLSILQEKVFDLEGQKFSKDIINSFQTDSEILTAIIDLLGLLLIGNQVLLAGYNREH